VAEQHFLAIQFNGLGIVEQRYAGFLRESLTDHEIAVAMHNPVFEQVAQNVERFRFRCLTLEKVHELLTDFRPAGLEVQIGNEECGHADSAYS
jgi:hypothetical protein